jgi:hypothetical protein
MDDSMTSSAFATPDTYAMRKTGVNASLLIRSVTVNTIDTSVGVGEVIGTGVVVVTIEPQETEPVIEYVPAPHNVQVDAPVALEYVPAPHNVQVDAPVALEYVPAPHNVQVDAPVALEYVPAPHNVQVDAPVALEYVPAPQGVHVNELAVSEYVPVIQDVHVDAPEVLE